MSTKILPTCPPQLRHSVIEVALSAVAALAPHPEIMNKLCHLAMTVQRGLFVIPIYLPGTAWYKVRGIGFLSI